MKLADIIRKGRGSTHGWVVHNEDGWATLIHWHTPLLKWNTNHPSEYEVLGTGWGSVSDQNGLNTAFSIFGIPLRMDRDERGGGPRISELPR